MISQPWWWLALLLAPVVYWRVAARWRSWVLAATSAFVLFLVDRFAPFVLVGAVIVWRMARVEDKAARRRWMALAIAGTLGGLALFKVGVPWWTGKHLAPIGLSYLAFRVLHVCLDARRGGPLPATLGEWLGYLLFFPIVSAGPIELLPHFKANTAPAFASDHVLQGLTRIAIGIVKKVVLVELLLRPALPDVLADGLTTAAAWRFAVLQVFFAYLDFASYSDIAIGGARLFGITVVENFDWPLLATDLTVFWRRWHMSLLGWCQSYVYMPLLGRTRNPHLASIATFTVIALWHGIGWNWLLWGWLHAAGVIVVREWSRRRPLKAHPVLDHVVAQQVKRVLLFGFVCFPTAIAACAPWGVGAGLRVWAAMLGLG